MNYMPPGYHVLKIKKIAYNPLMEKKEKKIKIGFDMHGVIDTKPEFFRTLIKLLVDNGHEVHIITGAKSVQEKNTLKELGIPFTHVFSITEHYEKLGTPISWDEKGEPHLNAYLWDKAKAAYCKEHDIDLHLDDSDIYHYFFKTPYARFFAKDSHRTKKTHL
jgi:hypothetical protein